MVYFQFWQEKDGWILQKAGSALMSPTKWLPITFFLWWVQTFKYHCKVWVASLVFFGVKLAQVLDFLGIYVKNNPFKAFLYQLAGSVWFHMRSNLHIRLQFATQLQNSVNLMLFVTESWLAWDSVSFCLTHENVSVLTVTGVKHMCSSQECNSLTTEEVPGYHLCCLQSLK